MAGKYRFLIKKSWGWFKGGADVGGGHRAFKKPQLGFSAVSASMGATQDKVVVAFNDVPQDFTPIAGVQILVDGVDDLNAAIAPVLSGQTLTYTLNGLAPADVLIQWVYVQPPGLISDGTDLAPSRTLTAQSAQVGALAWQTEAGPNWELDGGGTWDLE